MGLASRGAPAQRPPSRGSQTASQFLRWALWPSLWPSLLPSQAAHAPGRTLGHGQSVTPGGERGAISPSRPSVAFSHCSGGGLE